MFCSLVTIITNGFHPRKFIHKTDFRQSVKFYILENKSPYGIYIYTHIVVCTTEKEEYTQLSFKLCPVNNYSIVYI